MALMILPLIGSVSVSESLFVVTTLCVVYLVLKFFRTDIPVGLRRLPGPKALPFIGNLLGSSPYLSLTAMSKRYGDVFQIQIGMRPVVVLSGSETVRQALIKQGHEFSSRPDLYSFRMINDGKSLSFSSDHVGIWRARRKLAYSALRSFSTLEGTAPEYTCVLEEHICKEGEYLINQFNTVMKANGSFDPFRYIVVSVANVICGMCFGRRYDHNDEELLSFVNISDEFSKVAGSGYLADFIPILRFLPSTTMKKFLSINDRFNIFVHKINYYSKTYPTTATPMSKCFDTVSTALSWSVMYLVAYPEIQERLYQELKDKVGLDRTPCLSDKPRLPLLEAFILELFRHSSFMPFTIPHCTSKDTSLNGYFIPKDTCVFINQWQINHDPELWKDPSSFYPDRFLTADGNDVNKIEGEKMMIFGMGKRRCIGEVIARNEVFLFLAILIQKLNFLTVPGEPLDMTPEYGLTMKHKRCHLRAKMRTRKEQ
uniref:Cytochrome P450 1A n=1 Tax=Mola mola TaxID=94237 RepID=A0A3Q4BLZ0_MOLML